MVHKWARWLYNPCRLGVPNTLERGANSQVPGAVAGWLHNSCRLGGAQRLRGKDQMGNGPQVGQVAI